MRSRPAWSASPNSSGNRSNICNKPADASDQGLLICNPPYGERIGQQDALAPTYRALGDKRARGIRRLAAGRDHLGRGSRPRHRPARAQALRALQRRAGMPLPAVRYRRQARRRSALAKSRCSEAPKRSPTGCARPSAICASDSNARTCIAGVPTTPTFPNIRRRSTSTTGREESRPDKRHPRPGCTSRNTPPRRTFPSMSPRRAWPTWCAAPAPPSSCRASASR